MTLSNEDILDVVKILVELRNGAARSTTSTTSATVAFAASASSPRTSTGRAWPGSRRR
jgi:hypothetical protein